MSTIAEANALLDTASSAFQAGDYATARRNAAAAQAKYAQIPDTEKDGRSIRFRDGEPAALVKQAERFLAGSVGVQVTKITREAVSD